MMHVLWLNYRASCNVTPPDPKLRKTNLNFDLKWSLKSFVTPHLSRFLQYLKTNRATIFWERRGQTLTLKMKSATIGVLSWKATGAWSNTWRELYSTVVFYQQRNISKIRSVLFFSSSEKTFVPLRPLAPITVCFVHLPKQTNRQARKLFKILQLDQWPKQSNSHTSHRFFGFTLLDSIFWKTF